MTSPSALGASTPVEEPPTPNIPENSQYFETTMIRLGQEYSSLNLASCFMPFADVSQNLMPLPIFDDARHVAQTTSNE